MNIGLLLAAGKSKRFKRDKLFENISGKPVICHSLKFLEESHFVDEIFIVVNSENKNKIESFVRDGKFKKIKKIFLGGETRFESVKKIVPHIFPSHANYFVIHNAANSFAEEEELDRCFAAFKQGVSGVAVGRKIHSTIKKAKTLSWFAPVEVEKTIPRQNLWEVETPQVVRAKDFLNACKHITTQEFDYTDDLSVLEAAGMKTVIVEANPRNRKITQAGDIPEEFAIGIGEDSHRFKSQISKSKIQINPKFQNPNKSQKLILGGVEIRALSRLSADSDGDVILHALSNAISSAIGSGSLGTYATKMCKAGIKDSKKYLEKVLKNARAKNFKIIQCSISIEAAKPKIDPLSSKIKKSLSALLKIPIEKIGITATSGEGLTPFGHGKGVRCQSVVLLRTGGAKTGKIFPSK